MAAAMQLSIETNRLDRFAMGLSGLCLVHCVATAVLLGLLASAGGILGSPIIHEVGLTLAMIVGSFALGRGILEHGFILPSAVGAAGLGIMAGALSLLQCAALLGIVRAVSELQGDFVQTLGILWLSSLVGAAMGLCAIYSRDLEGGFGEPPPKIWERNEPVDETIPRPPVPCSSHNCVGAEPVTYTSGRVAGQFAVANSDDSGSIMTD